MVRHCLGTVAGLFSYKPTDATNGSMTWIFCNGVTMSNFVD
jgi:hypothetical protein